MNFLMIHGSWHGAWCWHKIVPRLEAEGHKAFAVNLLGRGRDPALPIFVTLDRLVKQVGKFLPTNEKTTIVVHSRYGILASRLAETYPNRIERTIYLASLMLPTGKTAAEYFRLDTDSWLRSAFELNKVGMWDRLKPEIYREGLYHDCSDDDVALGHMLLAREPLRPILEKLKLTDAAYGQIPRAYIRLTEDRAVSPALQDRILNDTKVERVESIEASHSAYFSKPDELTRAILKLASK